MTRIALIAVVVLAGLTAAPTSAQKPSTQYFGSTAQRFEFELRTSRTARTIERLRFKFRARRCDNARNGAQGAILHKRRIRIRSGRFAGRGRQIARIPRSRNFAGGTQVERWRVRGRFSVNQERAFGKLRVTVLIRNRAGVHIDTCRTTRAIRFRARSVGVSDEYTEIPAG